MLGCFVLTEFHVASPRVAAFKPGPEISTAPVTQPPLALSLVALEHGLAELRLESGWALRTIEQLDSPVSDREVWQIQPLLVLAAEGTPASHEHWSAPAGKFVGSATWK